MNISASFRHRLISPLAPGERDRNANTRLDDRLGRRAATAVRKVNEARRRPSLRERAQAQSEGDDRTAFEYQIDSDEKPNGPEAREGPAREKKTSKGRAHDTVEHVKPYALDVRR